MNFSGLLLPSTFLELSLAMPMNNNASGCENSEEITKWKDDVSKNSGRTIMSYKCSFCKRSFSNAQALGGHMNIHRKDRAKLREFSNENLLSLDITKTIDLDGEGSPDPTVTKKKPNSCDELEDVVPTISKHSTVRGLPLFAEMPLVCDDEKNLEKKNLDLIHGEVDLELRLGHEP